MTEFYLKINGIDITKHIAHGGVKWSRNDVEAPDAGRTLDGIMHRGRVSTKIRLDITTVPMRTADLIALQLLLEPEYVEVEYLDLLDGPVVKKMYSNNINVEVALTQAGGKHIWNSFTFPLIEV